MFTKLTTPGPEGRPSSSYFAEFRKSSLHGGQDPDGFDGMDHSLRPGEQGRQTYMFVGLAGDGSAVWGKWWADTHKSYGAPASFIYAAMAMDQVKGVRYVMVGRSGLCGIYMAEAPDWPSPGPNYVRVGTTGTGPVYARYDAAKADVQRILTSVHGTPTP